MTGTVSVRQSTTRDRLRCRVCGSVFPEARATVDGWHYRCPVPGCDGEGLGEGLQQL